MSGTEAQEVPAGGVAPNTVGQRVEQIIAKSGLPAELRVLIGEVVSRSGLWAGERADVARELCAHFADGLEAGRSSADLVRDFGDPKPAAAMIRRAKKRGRPAVYRAFVRTVQGAGLLVGLLLLVYGLLALRYFTGEPTLRHNFAKDLNAPILAAPKEEKAWPLYIEAVRALGPAQPFMQDGETRWPIEPGKPGWEEGTAWLSEHAAGVELIRQAAARPMLGVVYSNEPDREYWELKYPATVSNRDTNQPPQENPMLMGILLPHLGEMRSMARVLKSDAAVAIEEGDSARALADIRALLGMASQAQKDEFSISRLVGIALATLAAETTLDTLAMPGFWSGEDRVRLAHVFGAFGGGRLSMASDLERLSWEDIAQRVYSDDGHGDGHLIHAAFEPIFRDFGVSDPFKKPIVKFAMPAVAAWSPSRKDFLAQVGRVSAALARDDSLPPWRHAERTSGQETLVLTDMCKNPLAVFRSMIDSSQLDENRNFWTRDLFETLRGTVLVACALETFKAAHGAYPGALAQLIPTYLPAVPLDPFDGQPLRYMVKDGRPMVYSIGTDRTDDGGRLPANGVQMARHPAPARIVSPNNNGDWVIYPRVKDTTNSTE